MSRRLRANILFCTKLGNHRDHSGQVFRFVGSDVELLKVLLVLKITDVQEGISAEQVADVLPDAKGRMAHRPATLPRYHSHLHRTVKLLHCQSKLMLAWLHRYGLYGYGLYSYGIYSCDRCITCRNSWPLRSIPSTLTVPTTRTCAHTQTKALCRAGCDTVPRHLFSVFHGWPNC